MYVYSLLYTYVIIIIRVLRSLTYAQLKIIIQKLHYTAYTSI